MKKVISFNNEDEFVAYRKKKTFLPLGGGGSGDCYLGKDGLVYKDLTDGYDQTRYDVDSFVTTDDITVESFIFPDTLFAVDGKLVGYTSKFIRNNMFTNDFIWLHGLDKIDFDKILESYNDMTKDALVLAKEGIRIFDLSYNIIFDGKKIFGIDTDFYRKVDYDVIEHNLKCVDRAIKDEFVMILNYAYDIKTDNIDMDTDMKTFLKTVKKTYEDAKKGKQYTY